ncbi:hypothetical protein M407DRAFT_87871 [Tulasnella calospora MUT 4182]|uniref:Uncharacterized protein n=1 Tax=Tulasnella calospora MUT 4182 TaxID=1051891 RepID=A0A0C3MLF0_9AGAM|nr:hypothetical protein M407DRAFT_87871 [Tulasnella calospora MUT 4182]
MELIKQLPSWFGLPLQGAGAYPPQLRCESEGNWTLIRRQRRLTRPMIYWVTPERKAYFMNAEARVEVFPVGY